MLVGAGRKRALRVIRHERWYLDILVTRHQYFLDYGRPYATQPALEVIVDTVYSFTRLSRSCLRLVVYSVANWGL